MRNLINKIIKTLKMTKTLKLDDTTARKLYLKAEPAFKTMLEENWSKEFFNQDITDRIKSYEDACEYQGIESLSLSDFKFLPKGDQKSSFAFHKLTVIARSLNEGWEPDWNNSGEWKWYAWFKGSGSGFAFFSTFNWRADSNAGSRLCFKTDALATYAGKHFVAIYKDFMDI